MCGIVGYVGPQDSVPILMEGLRRLEYRGYDSAGVAILNGDGLKVEKTAGKIAMLEERINATHPSGTLGIAHTRWATHGEPNTVNAHPHVDCKGRIAVVHNGIIENFSTLKKKLHEEGHRFTTETDTEVIAHLIEKFYTGNLEKAVAAALRAGDPLAQRLFQEVVEALGTGLAVIANAFNPARLILGGGVIEGMPELVAAAEREARLHALSAALRPLRIVRSRLGADAGAIGAAAQIRQRLEGDRP